METKPRWKFVLVEMKPIYLRLRDKPYFGGNGAENPCLSVSKKKSYQDIDGNFVSAERWERSYASTFVKHVHKNKVFPCYNE